ncbi:MAG: efflux RND transporter periplasmic adaptor subunit [Candidatus Marinimicrobia bacterium]|nr:efflux RND transporter periplasmic adaptor subunit [Candidatus Neomarinimicrobiota bacterium]
MKITSKKTKLILSIVGAIFIFVIGWKMGNDPVTAPAAVEAATESTAPTIWTCAMHPQIKLPSAGQCPICFMDLIPLEAHDTDVVPRQLKLSESAVELAKISTTKVLRQVVENPVLLSGKVEYDETLVSRITAWIPGRLERLYVDYTGIRVNKGDHMVELYSPELITAQEELIQAYKQVNLGGNQNQSKNETVMKTLDAARKKFLLLGLTEDQIRTIEKQDSPTNHVIIYSPVSGIVIHKNAFEGMYVTTGTPIYTIADLSRVWVVLDAYESQVPFLRFGQEVTFSAESIPGKTFTGAIAYIDPVLDEKSRTVKVRLNVANDDGLLKPGAFIRGTVHSTLDSDGNAINPDMADKWVGPMHPEIVKDKPGKCDICGMDLVPAKDLGIVNMPKSDKLPLVVPASAVLKTGKRAVVYVKVPGTDSPVFEGREVAVSSRAGDYYIIMSGLAEGEEVVTNGNFKIDSALQISAKPSMMAPEGGMSGTGHDHSGMSAKSPGAKPKPESINKDYHLNLTPALSEKVFAAYIKLQSTLAKDDYDKSYSALMEIHKLTMGVKGAEEIMKPTMKSADNIDALRGVFEELSQVMRFAAKTGLFSAPVNEAFCPMAFDFKGAYWLQTGKEINNPYFGSKMLRCGEIRRQWNSPAENK